MWSMYGTMVHEAQGYGRSTGFTLFFLRVGEEVSILHYFQGRSTSEDHGLSFVAFLLLYLHIV